MPIWLDGLVFIFSYFLFVEFFQSNFLFESQFQDTNAHREGDKIAVDPLEVARVVCEMQEAIRQVSMF
jgi:hypothetical protein